MQTADLYILYSVFLSDMGQFVFFCLFNPDSYCISWIPLNLIPWHSLVLLKD